MDLHYLAGKTIYFARRGVGILRIIHFYCVFCMCADYHRQNRNDMNLCTCVRNDANVRHSDRT